ncbi:hypothetical protein [Microbacterium sp. PM5]|uniref:hypothetical protein n=1 Tax=Microbacterium sp. PM5 TaxID=2014534 RepID=UPI0013AF666B|nr:hypothetical protein [Microbacterium sp. PM5]
MRFPHGRTVWRLRGGPVWDEYSETYKPEDWEHPILRALPKSFIAQTSTALLATATRDQASEAKSLFCDGALDVQKSDRIFDGTFTPPLPETATVIPAGTVFVGATYQIDGIPPAADTNPFTAFTPPREIPLTRYVG